MAELLIQNLGRGNRADSAWRNFKWSIPVAQLYKCSYVHSTQCALKEWLVLAQGLFAAAQVAASLTAIDSAQWPVSQAAIDEGYRNQTKIMGWQAPVFSKAEDLDEIDATIRNTISNWALEMHPLLAANFLKNAVWIEGNNSRYFRVST
jgi:hypothetical protein